MHTVRPACADLLDHADHLVHPAVVDAGARLVEQQHFGLGGQDAGQGDQLLLPEAERARPALRPGLHVDESQPLVRPLAGVLLRLGAPRGRRNRLRIPSPAVPCTPSMTLSSTVSDGSTRTSWNERAMPILVTTSGRSPVMFSSYR